MSFTVRNNYSRWPAGVKSRYRCPRRRGGSTGRLPFWLTAKSHRSGTESAPDSLFVAFPVGKPAATCPGMLSTHRGSAGAFDPRIGNLAAAGERQRAQHGECESTAWRAGNGRPPRTRYLHAWSRAPVPDGLGHPLRSASAPTPAMTRAARASLQRPVHDEPCWK